MDWSEILGSLVDIGGLGYSVYSGERANATAEDMYSMSAGLTNDQAKLAREQWARYKSIYGPVEEAEAAEALADIQLWKPYKQEMVASLSKQLELNDPLMERQAVIQGDMLDYTGEELERSKAYRPIEDEMIAEAEGGIDPARYVERARGDVARGFDNAQAIEQRNLGRLGATPDAGRREASGRQWAINRALGEAGAATNARLSAEDLARNIRTATLNYKKGFAMPQISTPASMPMLNPTQATGGASMRTGAITSMDMAGNNAAYLGNVAGKAAQQGYQTAGYLLPGASQGVQQVGQAVSGLFETPTQQRTQAVPTYMT